jgi:hypothetical protein
MPSVKGNEYVDVYSGRRAGARTKPLTVDVTWTLRCGESGPLRAMSNDDSAEPASLTA